MMKHQHSTMPKPWEQNSYRRGAGSEIRSIPESTAQGTKKLPAFSSLKFQGGKDICSLWYIKTSLGHLGWAGKQNSNDNARREQVPKEHHSPSAGPVVEHATLVKKPNPYLTRAGTQEQKWTVGNSLWTKVWRFPNNLDVGGYLLLNSLWGPTMFYIKQEPDKMCKIELNKTRAAQLWEDSWEKNLLSWWLLC